MGRRSFRTPRSHVRNALRRLYLQSRERAAACRAEDYTCEGCHKKQSRAKGREFKIEVHHRAGKIDWESLIDLVYDRLLVHPDQLEVLCKECHKDVHDG